ncbi:MAG: hypothetical protein ACRC1T_01150 [Clostridium chrysemydis]|uniref:hypothetical protein n=1 Tax=Clostridium chrysemydis TaxID=2665504 RepID=UPI003F2DF852
MVNHFDLNAKELHTNNEVDGSSTRIITTATVTIFTITATSSLTTVIAGSGANYSEDAVCSINTF